MITLTPDCACRDLAYLQRKFEVRDEKVLLKTRELVRLAEVRCRSMWAQNQRCVGLCCFEIAAKLLGSHIDRSLAVRISGVKTAARYQSKLTMVRNVLGIKSTISIRELCVRFGCQSLGTQAIDLKKAYCGRFLQGLSQSSQACADFSNGAYAAAAFYLTARKNKAKVSRKKLVSVAGCSESKFASVITSFLKLCKDLVGLEDTESAREDAVGSQGGDAGAARKKKTKFTDKVVVDGEELSLEDVQNNPHLSDEVRREAKEVEDYQAFRAKYLEEKRREKEDRKKNSRGTKRTRQVSLLSFATAKPKRPVQTAKRSPAKRSPTKRARAAEAK